jgi:hypothetical protein
MIKIYDYEFIDNKRLAISIIDDETGEIFEGVIEREV